jgi:hypothetical protein
VLSVFLVGCSSIIDSNSAENLWQERFEYCQSIAVSNKISIPDSKWFDSLVGDDKKTVIGYLANYTDRKCMSAATEVLRDSLFVENNQSKIDFYSVDLASLDELAGERIKHLDKKELDHLKNKMSKPFNLRFALEEEGLYPKGI